MFYALYMNPLQSLITRRLAELGTTQRKAAERSDGLISAMTLSRICRGHTARVSARSISGIAIALDLRRAVVEKAAAAAARPQQWADLSSAFAKLTPERQGRVVAAVREIAAEQEAEIAQQASATRPFGR